MKRKGFTLIELLVATSIFALMLSTVYLVLGQEIRLWNRLADQTAAVEISNIVFDKLAADARSASAILPGSTANKLLLQVASGTIEYSFNDQKIRRRKNSRSTYLTDRNDLAEIIFNYAGPRLVGITIGQLSTSASLRNR